MVWNHHCCWHANSGGPALRDVLSRLPISATDIAIDVGCGKGGAMITMSFFPFRRVDGVEISPHLAETARQNLRRLRVHNASVFCCDAGEFRKFDPYTFVYMFNPFPESVMAEVMNNLQDSLIHQPRLLTLVYFNPLYHSCVVENGFETVGEYTDAGHPFRIYRPSAPGRGPRGVGLGARTL